VSFYTAASTDPAHHAFYTHMPRFYGSLKQAPAEQQEELQGLLKGSDGVGAPPAGAVPAAQPEDGNKPADAAKSEVPLGKGEEWTPSGGKKLSTGLLLAISNATAGITKPCVLDVKLGARLWDDDAPIAKRQKLDEVSNSSTSGSLGFRVAGMKVWAVDGMDEEEHSVMKDGYRVYDKFYGRDFDKDSVNKAFESFFGGLEGGKLKRKNAEMLRKRFVRELESMEYTLANEESRMYSASILMVYEGDDEALEKALALEGKEKPEEDEEEEGDDDDDAEPKVHDACLIDFAHAKFCPGEGPDENALQGIRSALAILKSLA
jgi:inositol-polyphosphate multikinase